MEDTNALAGPQEREDIGGEAAPQAGSLVSLLQDLARQSGPGVASFLPAFDEAVLLPGSTTTVRTHFLAHDVNGAPATDVLAQTMASAALDFCIPRDKILAAQEKLLATGSTKAFVALSLEARDLFVKSEKSGEGGELLLFLLMEEMLKRPQILSKMALKTNGQVHVHGSDGVHASLADDGILDLFWGESKLYASSSEAFKDCFESISPFLRADGDAARKRDLLLVRDHLDVPGLDLARHLLEYFDETNPKRLQVRWNGVCLVGFSRVNYPNISILTEKEREQVSRAVGRWQTTALARVKEFDIAGVNIDLFCIPFPDVGQLRTLVLQKMGIK